MESQGTVAAGALKEARKLSNFFKYEPLKFVQAVHNSVIQGCGLNMDTFLPRASVPGPPAATDLEDKGACVFLGDQEKKQNLGKQLMYFLDGLCCGALEQIPMSGLSSFTSFSSSLASVATFAMITCTESGMMPNFQHSS